MSLELRGKKWITGKTIWIYSINRLLSLPGRGGDSLWFLELFLTLWTFFFSSPVKLCPLFNSRMFKNGYNSHVICHLLKNKAIEFYDYGLGLLANWSILPWGVWLRNSQELPCFSWQCSFYRRMPGCWEFPLLGWGISERDKYNVPFTVS